MARKVGNYFPEIKLKKFGVKLISKTTVLCQFTKTHNLEGLTDCIHANHVAQTFGMAIRLDPTVPAWRCGMRIRLVRGSKGAAICFSQSPLYMLVQSRTDNEGAFSPRRIRRKFLDPVTINVVHLVY